MFTANFRPVDDFLGLSPDEVHRLLYQRFAGSLDIVTLSATFAPALLENVPAVQDAMVLIRRLGEAGSLKATQKGNFPLMVVREIYKQQTLRDLEEEWNVASEEDALLVRLLRHALTACGWMKCRSKQFSLTKKGEVVYRKGFLPEHYQQLLQNWIFETNWGFLDGHNPCPFVQHAALFSLYLLSQKAADFTLASDLSGAFVRAFPAALPDVISPFDSDTPQAILSRIFELRFLERFCLYFGLLEFKGKRKHLLDGKPLEVKTTELFRGVFCWKLSRERQRVFVESIAGSGGGLH